MSNIRKDKTLIGRVEEVFFPEFGNLSLSARVDTGAKTSSVWASKIKETADGLVVRLASPKHDIHKHEVIFKRYDRVFVASSMGHGQMRYRVNIKVVLGGRKINAKFTLADRSTQVYPVLLGRSILLRKFIVDVENGAPLKEAERLRSKALQDNIKEKLV